MARRHVAKITLLVVLCAGIAVPAHAAADTPAHGWFDSATEWVGAAFAGLVDSVETFWTTSRGNPGNPPGGDLPPATTTDGGGEGGSAGGCDPNGCPGT